MFLYIALFSLVSWLSFQLSIYGSIVSLIRQTKIALKELFESPLPEGVVTIGPGYTWEGYVYAMLRLRWGQFIILTSTVLAFTSFFTKRTSITTKVIASWVLLHTLGIGFVIYALRWVDRPFQYLALTSPLLLLALTSNARFRRPVIALMYSILMVGVSISPIIIWGPSPFMYPPSSDTSMANFLATHISEHHYSVAHIGSHGLLPFYYELKGSNFHGKDLLWDFKQGIGFDINEVKKYEVVAMFFRTYGKSGFYEYRPNILDAVKNLQGELMRLGYNKVFEAILEKEWIMVKP